MKINWSIKSAFAVVLIAGIVAALAFARNIVRAQSSSSAVSKTAKVEPAVIDKSPASSARFANAALANAKLRDGLTWDFGGKSQFGWRIYVPLISQTIGTDRPADSVEFASALSAWQSRRGISPSGLLDETTLGELTKFWQSQRLFKSDVPGDDKLLSAPIAEFYDPTRNPDLLKLERETYAAYKRMLAAAAKDLGKSLKLTRSGELAPDEKYFRIVSAFRSPAYQESLRKKEPNAGRGALAKFSAHATGQAIDMYVGGEPVTTKDANRLIQIETPAYLWLVKNASRFGFYPYFYEPWHWEYVPKK